MFGLTMALNSVSDHPTAVFEYFIQFEREEGTLEQLDKALEKVNAQALLRASRVQTQKPKEETAGKKVHGKESFELIRCESYRRESDHVMMSGKGQIRVFQKRGADKAPEPKVPGRKRLGTAPEDVVPSKKQV
ncbi:hypothetical protein TELCIR_19557 [Teladorsagia circumcincta]|uniref:Uncharacterized protein n=1 Tax=Teladorsagia circumcincta TaxID=45464 RepID=A0A2G9TND3_TELCI|nr:hypothetical protein TELCIR_19557 [Teladorsagia circumcincta]